MSFIDRFKNNFALIFLILVFLSVIVIEFTACGGVSFDVLLPGFRMDPGVRIYG
jgi:hypothetical protein